jgi:hypothetical protein
MSLHLAMNQERANVQVRVDVPVRSAVYWITPACAREYKDGENSIQAVCNRACRKCRLTSR